MLHHSLHVQVTEYMHAWAVRSVFCPIVFLVARCNGGVSRSASRFAVSLQTCFQKWLRDERDIKCFLLMGCANALLRQWDVANSKSCQSTEHSVPQKVYWVLSKQENSGKALQGW